MVNREDFPPRSTFSLREAAAYIGVGFSTLNTYRRDNFAPTEQKNDKGNVFFYKEDLDSWIEKYPNLVKEPYNPNEPKKSRALRTQKSTVSERRKQPSDSLKLRLTSKRDELKGLIGQAEEELKKIEYAIEAIEKYS